MQEAIRQHVRSLRTKLQITQAEVALAIGVSQPTFARFELGELTLPAEAISKIMALFFERATNFIAIGNDIVIDPLVAIGANSD